MKIKPEAKANIAKVIILSTAAVYLYIAYERATIYGFLAAIFVSAILILYASPTFQKENWE